MSTLEEHGYSRSHPPELAMLLLLAAFVVGITLSLPWW